MSDNLREAANRCLSWYEEKSEAYKLAKAWLAANPADDAEPITAEWLKACGLVWKPEWLAFTTEGLSDECWLIDNQPGGVWTVEYEDEFCWPHDLRTRGELRRLLACCGITLQEGAVTS